MHFKCKKCYIKYIYGLFKKKRGYDPAVADDARVAVGVGTAGRDIKTAVGIVVLVVGEVGRGVCAVEGGRRELVAAEDGGVDPVV